MILCVYKPIRINGEIDNYELVDNNSIYNKGSYFYRVVYKCDGTECKNPDKIYSINRDKLSEKRSKTINEKIQICRSCQTTGINNPRFGDNRKWDELHSAEKSDLLKKNMSERVSGDLNPSKNPEVISTKNRNNFERYGVENVFQLDFVKEKSRNTSLLKYGVEHPMMSDVVKEKSRNTSLLKYGVEHPMMCDFIKEKSFNSSLKNHGVHHTKSEEFKERIRNTNLTKYGVDNFTKS